MKLVIDEAKYPDGEVVLRVHDADEPEEDEPIGRHYATFSGPDARARAENYMAALRTKRPLFRD